MILPPVDTDIASQERLIEATSKIAFALKVTGPMNVQFLRTPDGSLKVIEANVRASRSVPFVSKVLGINFPEIMARSFVSEVQLKPVSKDLYKIQHYGVKAAMFSWIRLDRADPILGVEMSSTGEVGVFGRVKEEVFLKALMCTTFKIPRKGICFSIDGQENNEAYFPSIKLLAEKTKLALFALPETYAFLQGKLPADRVQLVYSPKNAIFAPNYSQVVLTDQFNLVIQLRIKTNDFLLRRCTYKTASEDYTIRRMAIDYGKSLLTELRVATWFARCFTEISTDKLEIEPYSSYRPADRPRPSFE